jgi:hypothetical protein
VWGEDVVDDDARATGSHAGEAPNHFTHTRQSTQRSGCGVACYVRMLPLGF